jgi:hypothetical protein
MLSILVSSRVQKNPDTNMKRLLDSAVQFVEDYSKIEFILKYDFDDPEKPGDDFFAQYPFVIKRFI